MKHVAIDLVEVEVGLMMTMEAPDVLGMLADMPNLVEILTVIRDMLTRARAMLDRGVAEVIVLLARKTGRRIDVLRKGRPLKGTRIVVWDLRQVMRSASRR